MYVCLMVYMGLSLFIIRRAHVYLVVCVFTRITLHVKIAAVTLISISYYGKDSDLKIGLFYHVQNNVCKTKRKCYSYNVIKFHSPSQHTVQINKQSHSDTVSFFR